MNFFNRVRCMIHKEFLSNVKDPKTRLIIIVPVIVQSLLFGYAATFNLERVPYALLDLSHSESANNFLAKLEGGGVFQRVKNLASTNEIAEARLCL